MSARMKELEIDTEYKQLDERLRAVETIATELLGKYQTLIEGINDANTKYQTILDRMDKYAKGK